MENKFREVKDYCTTIVKRYKTARKDDRAFPEFLIRTLAYDGSKGEVHLYRKPKGEKNAYISKGKIHYESISELSFILECLGNAWEREEP
jgi:hypothetical protein